MFKTETSRYVFPLMNRVPIVIRLLNLFLELTLIREERKAKSGLLTQEEKELGG